MVDPSKLPIRYWADLNDGTGFNVAARGYLAAFKSLGYDPSTLRLLAGIPNEGRMSPADAIEPYTHGSIDNDRINIVHLNPGLLRELRGPQGQPGPLQPVISQLHTSAGERYNIAITAWETNSLPKAHDIVGDLNLYDEIWVPTQWVKESFEKCGVDKPIFVIPHALLPELLVEEPEAGLLPGDIIFYTMGTWNERKDIEMVVRSYLECGWSPVSGSRLNIYSVPPTRNRGMVRIHALMVQEKVTELVQTLPDPDSAPQFGLFTNYDSYEKVVQRHRVGNVFVSASHGEGFGLPALEAAAMGNWVIGGGPWLEELSCIAGDVEHGGLVELLPSKEVPVRTSIHSPQYETGQKWWTVEQADLTRAMVDTFEILKEFGLPDRQAAAQRVRDYYSPRSVGEMIAERLKQVR